MDRRAWRATVLRVTESDMPEATRHTHMHTAAKGALVTLIIHLGY